MPSALPPAAQTFSAGRITAPPPPLSRTDPEPSNGFGILHHCKSAKHRRLVFGATDFRRCAPVEFHRHAHPRSGSMENAGYVQARRERQSRCGKLNIVSFDAGAYVYLPQNGTVPLDPGKDISPSPPPHRKCRLLSLAGQHGDFVFLSPRHRLEPLRQPLLHYHSLGLVQHHFNLATAPPAPLPTP